MFEGMTYEKIMERMLARVPNSMDKREGSVIWDALAPAAKELEDMYFALSIILQETFGDTASRSNLIRRASERGIIPYSKAVLKGIFDIEVPLGSRYSLDDLNYTVTKFIQHNTGTGLYEYQVECETPGRDGGRKTGDIIPIDYINGLGRAEITELLIPGQDEEETEKQIAKYDRIVSIFDSNSIKYRFRHIQASPLLFKYRKKYNYDFARVGMAIYGMEPLSENIGLFPVLKLSSKIINIRKLSKGEKVSYGSQGKLKENKTVAVIPVGYAHGLQKQIENNGAYVLINGKKAKILGEVCMDMIIVDITDIPDVKIGSEAVITGKQGNEEITLLQMAEWAGAIQDDILTKWNKGIKRILV